jgi:hypothetical protein
VPKVETLDVGRNHHTICGQLGSYTISSQPWKAVGAANPEIDYLFCHEPQSIEARSDARERKACAIGSPKYKNLKLREEKKGMCSQLHICVNTGPMLANAT